eukprot:scaffold840_cov344-Pavlova_lutheri.AAC.16
MTSQVAPGEEFTKLRNTNSYPLSKASPFSTRSIDLRSQRQDWPPLHKALGITIFTAKFKLIGCGSKRRVDSGTRASPLEIHANFSLEAA